MGVFIFNSFPPILFPISALFSFGGNMGSGREGIIKINPHRYSPPFSFYWPFTPIASPFLCEAMNGD